jgi:hypothetical protein
MQHCDRPWWKRPPAWFIAIALLAVTGCQTLGSGSVPRDRLGYAGAIA